MGDTGSLFIGLLLAAGSLARPSKSPTALIIAGPLFALALPVLDTLIVMQQRFRGQKSTLLERVGRVFTADRRHIHHILVTKYQSEGKAIFWIWLVTLLFATSAVMITVQTLKWFGYGSGALALVLLVVLRYSRRERPV
jgi:UDP-GlcNAc:undecaprenyl-phosphate GlcNAc-1-phosphate transferase